MPPATPPAPPPPPPSWPGPTPRGRRALQRRRPPPRCRRRCRRPSWSCPARSGWSAPRRRRGGGAGLGGSCAARWRRAPAAAAAAARTVRQGRTCDLSATAAEVACCDLATPDTVQGAQLDMAGLARWALARRCRSAYSSGARQPPTAAGRAAPGTAAVAAAEAPSAASSNARAKHACAADAAADPADRKARAAADGGRPSLLRRRQPPEARAVGSGYKGAFCTTCRVLSSSLGATDSVVSMCSCSRARAATVIVCTRLLMPVIHYSLRDYLYPGCRVPESRRLNLLQPQIVLQTHALCWQLRSRNANSALAKYLWACWPLPA